MSGEINIGRDAQGNAFGAGSTVTNTNSFNRTVDPAAFESALAAFKREWAELQSKLPEDKKEEAGLLAEKLEDAATKDDPKSRAWYSISAKGLLEAAKWTKDFTGDIGATIRNLAKTIWPDFELPKAGE